MYPNPIQPMYALLLLASIAYAVIGMFFVVMNIGIVVHNQRGGKFVSSAGFVGGIFLATAILSQPIVILKYFFWVAFIIDFTWIILFPHFCYYVLPRV